MELTATPGSGRGPEGEVPVFTSPAVAVRRIELDRPWAWLAAGWRDMRQALPVSLAYGALAALTGYALTFGLIAGGLTYLALPLAAGFLIVGPILTVGLYEDGTPGELFLVMAKEGSTISGFADAFAQAISYALQYGVPLQDLVDKFSHVRFEPSGMTRNPDVRFAKSIVDYIFRWMATKFLSADAQFRAGVNNREELVTTPEQLPLDVAAAAGASPTAAIASPKTATFAAMQNQEDAPPCSTCGSIMVRSGSCYKCANCGTTSGCA